MFPCVPAMENPDKEMPILAAPDERHKIHRRMPALRCIPGGGHSAPPILYSAVWNSLAGNLRLNRSHVG